MPGLSRVLAAAGPDRFVSVLAEDVRRRISDIVGFELTAEGDEPFDALARYADAIEQIRAYPWASADSAERSSDHPDEADAWSKRVSLLGCFVA